MHKAHIKYVKYDKKQPCTNTVSCNYREKDYSMQTLLHTFRPLHKNTILRQRIQEQEEEAKKADKTNIKHKHNLNKTAQKVTLFFKKECTKFAFYRIKASSCEIFGKITELTTMSELSVYYV